MSDNTIDVAKNAIDVAKKIAGDFKSLSDRYLDLMVIANQWKEAAAEAVSISRELKTQNSALLDFVRAYAHQATKYNSGVVMVYDEDGAMLRRAKELIAKQESK